MGRAVRQLDDPEFAERMIKRVRGFFYSAMGNAKEGQYRPAYIDPENLNPENFIRLPVSPSRRTKTYPKGGLLGRHGALRLAASKVRMGNNNKVSRLMEFNNNGT